MEFFQKNKGAIVAVIVTAMFCIFGTCVVMKASRVYDKLEQTPEEAARIRRAKMLEEFDAWKVETKIVVAKALEEEKSNLKALGKAFLTLDLNKPLDAQINERTGVYRQLKKDVLAAYSGETMDFEKIRDEYLTVLITMKDDRLRNAIVACLGPIQDVYVQVHKADHLVDLKSQVDEFKAEMERQTRKAIEDELPLLSKN